MVAKIKKYFSFYGKATRIEYWCLTVASVFVPLFVMGIIALSFINSPQRIQNIEHSLILKVTFHFLVIFSLWVYFSTAVRRCRDASVSSFYVFLVFVPYTRWLSALTIGCLKTDEGKKDDLFGDNEKKMIKSPSDIWKQLSPRWTKEIIIKTIVETIKSPSHSWKKLLARWTKERKKTLLYQGRIMLLCHARVAFVTASIVFWLWTTSIAIQFFRTLFLVAFYGIRHIK